MSEHDRWVVAENDDPRRPYVVHDNAGLYGDMAQRSRAVAVRMVNQRNRKIPWPARRPEQSKEGGEGS